MNLQALLEPKSVAIVGASAEPAKISGMIVGFLRKSSYAGRVYLVNPRYERIGEQPCYPSVERLPETVDLVVCVVPAAVAFEAIEAAAHRGVPFCLLMTGGFGEGRTGAGGEARRQRLLEICKRTGMHVVGPNTVGMVNFRAGLPLTFADWYARDTGRRGGVAIVTHSGSVGGLLFSSLQLNGIGVDYWFGLGNEATLETADFIDHFNADPATHTVICYLEGVRSGAKFLRTAAEARCRGKRIVVMRAGGHPESARSTRSHTGKVPTASDVYAGVLRQFGVIDVRSLSEATYAMVLLTAVGARLGPRIGIVSASGGACSLLADHVVDAGLELPQLPRALQAVLDRAIPEYGSSLNPVDLSADVIARPEILHGTLAALRADDSIDVWLVFGRPIVDRYYPALIEFARTSGKAVIVCCGVPLDASVHAALREGGIAVLEDPQLCLQALGRIQRAARGAASEDHTTPPARAGTPPRERRGKEVPLLVEEGRDATGSRTGWSWASNHTTPALRATLGTHTTRNHTTPPASAGTPREMRGSGGEPASASRTFPSCQGGAGRDGVADGVVTSRLEPDTSTDFRPDRKPTGSHTVHAAIGNDREFGPILALTTAATRERIVRALPASPEQLRDAADELAAVDVRLAGAAEHIVASLRALLDSTPLGAEAHVDLPLES